MVQTTFLRRPILVLFACGLGLVGPAVWAEVKITKIEVDDHPVSFSADARSYAAQLRLSPAARVVKFYFTESVLKGQIKARLRYRLDGYDPAWRDIHAPTPMRAVVQFLDSDQQIVGENSFGMEGETPGWRGTAENSDFARRREDAVAPPRTATARILFISYGGADALGIMGMDDVRVVVRHPETGQPQEYDLRVTAGAALDQPFGSPALWQRSGLRASMAQLRMRATPQPHPILVINDDDDQRYALWGMNRQHLIPAQPGDKLTLEWQTAHSIGVCGPGVAEYTALPLGRYRFQVATAKPNGEITGVAVSLPLTVAVRFYQRWEFWLLMAALLCALAAWTGRTIARRRLQHKIAEHERQQTLGRERARIARDLHDDIGAGLTEIAMLGDWVRRDLAHLPLAETRAHVDRICRSAVELAHSTDEIVWAVNPANDNVDAFVTYLVQKIDEFLEATGLRLRLDIPGNLPATPLAGKVRHHLLLAVREALNNIAKHARADLARLQIRLEAAGLHIVVEDNGCGFVPGLAGAAGTHEGLKNMQKRMAEIGGQFRLTSHSGSGTKIEFSVPLQP